MYTFNNNYPIYTDYNTNLNIKHTLKHIIYDLKEYIYSLFNKYDKNYIELIKEKLNNIANILEYIPKLNNEFLDFLKIKKMLVYILNNYDHFKSKPINNFFDLISSFHELLLLKINYLKDENLKDQYQNEYAHFKSELNTSRNEFNKNIYKRSDIHDDTMINVSKILME